MGRVLIQNSGEPVKTAIHLKSGRTVGKNMKPETQFKVNIFWNLLFCVLLSLWAAYACVLWAGQAVFAFLFLARVLFFPGKV